MVKVRSSVRKDSAKPMAASKGIVSVAWISAPSTQAKKRMSSPPNWIVGGATFREEYFPPATAADWMVS